MTVLLRDLGVGWLAGFVVALLWYAVDGRHGDSVTTWGGAALVALPFGLATGLLWSARSAAWRHLDQRARTGGLAVLMVLAAGLLLALLL
ncbi:hypothetical protein ABFT23_07965 [Nocardioides sp. C4-1]|uniref:hypothetical protein n=1 Tax=Nocardioides sp. C4-1 TaxID=3151851 RepID=UPI0032638BB0